MHPTVSLRFVGTALSAASLLLVVSCKEDPELIRQREQQRAEIQKLEGELSLLNEKLKNAPTDKRGDLAEVEAETRKFESEITRLTADVAKLEEQKKQLEEEFADYQRKYPIR